jgi:ATP-binding cassette, subfamily B, bacterial
MSQAGAKKGGQRPSVGSMRSRLSVLIGDSRRTIVGVSALSFVTGLTEAATLALVAELAYSIVGRSVRGHGHGGRVGLPVIDLHVGTPALLAAAFALCALRLLLQVPLSMLTSRIPAEVQARLRMDLFDAFNRSSWAVQSRDRDGQLQETLTGQVMQAVSAATASISLLTSLVQFLVLLIVAVLLSPIAALGVALMSLVMFFVLRPLRALGGRFARQLSRAQVAFARGVAENNRVAEEIHVFGGGEAQRQKIAELVMHGQRYFYRTQLLARLITNAYQTLIYVLLIAGIGVLYLVGGQHPGAIGGVVLILLRAGSAGQSAQGSYQGLIQSLPFVERTQRAMERYREHAEKYGNRPLMSVDTIAFENVSFSYDRGVEVLSDLSFAIQGGESIGVVGPSGAGKSTLVQLLLRLRDPAAGSYLINGVPAAEFAAADWHRQVAYVPQQPRLLHASVAENIRFFREIDDGQVEQAARIARIHDDIMSWPKQYETIVGPRADAVSGGQQQRICLARGLAASPEMLILDEPTSALDPQSEALIAESLEAITSQLTLIIVAHRMSTLERCDRVLVVVDGRVVGFDTKTALMEGNAYYRNASELALTGGHAAAGAAALRASLAEEV